MNSKLQESKVKQLFAQQEVITNTDILYLYREKEPGIPEATVNWRIYHLVQKGVIQRIGRGKYREGKALTFSPKLSAKTIKNFPILIIVFGNCRQSIVSANI